jgi:hypothetical protein
MTSLRNWFRACRRLFDDRFDGLEEAAVRECASQRADLARNDFRLGTWGSRVDGNTPETVAVSRSLAGYLEAAEKYGERYGRRRGLIVGIVLVVLIITVGGIMAR